MIIIYVTDEQSSEIMRAIKAIKSDVGEMISIGAVVSNIDEILL